MTTAPQKPDPQAQAASAVCPYCAMDPVQFNIITAAVAIPGGAMALASIFCANPECRKLFNIEIVNQVKGGMPQTDGSPRIASPYGN